MNFKDWIISKAGSVWNAQRGLSLVLIVSGVALWLDQLLDGGFTLLDFWGHEWIGLFLLIIGFIVGLRKIK